MSAKNRLLSTILILVFWIASAGMTGLQSPLLAIRPAVRVTRVVHDTSVKFRADYFPAGAVVEVLIGDYGTGGVNGVKVGTFSTNSNGTLRTTVPIPGSLKGESKLDLRVQRRGYYGTSRRDYYAETSFSNVSSQPQLTHNLIMMKVTNVVKDTSVTVRYGNLPANVNFQVYLAVGDKKAGGPKLVGSFNSGAGGSLVATYSIPSSIAGRDLYFIYIQSTSQNISGLTIFVN